MDSPQIGMQVDMVRPGGCGDGCFEQAVVVDRATDPVFGVVLEMQFGDAWRVQRVWPSPAIRLLV